MAGVTSAILGGAALAKGFSDASKARKAAKTQQDLSLAMTAQDRAAIQQAQEDAMRTSQRLFGPAQQALQAGNQAALDIFGQALPEQTRLFQAGNVGAQQQLIAGLQPFQQALLGQPINFGALQPRQLTPNVGFMSEVSLPSFTPVAQALSTPTGTQEDPFTLTETDEQRAARLAVLDQPFEGSRLTPNDIRGFLQRGAPIGSFAAFGLDKGALERANQLVGDQNTMTTQVDLFGNPIEGSAALPANLTADQRQQFQRQRLGALGGLGGMAGINPAFLG